MLGDVLNSINWDKNNIAKGNEDAFERAYPRFPVLRSLSYHPDIILIVSELNKIGTADHCLTNKQHYEFLLNSIPKKRRFAKWGKVETDESIEVIMKLMNFSYEKAKAAAQLLTDEQMSEMARELEQGGTTKIK